MENIFITREHRRSISIHINYEGQVIVKAPSFMPMFMVNKFLETKREWIEKSLAKVTKHKKTKKEYKEGEMFLYLGQNLVFSVHNKPEIIPENGKLFFPRAGLFRAEKEITMWYQNQAKEVIGRRLKYYSDKMDKSYNGVIFSDTSSKWGTCFADNSLQFNWRLVMTPMPVLDYVVIHELAHTIHKHHGPNFWKEVSRFTPAYKQHRKWLAENNNLLFF